MVAIGIGIAIAIGFCFLTFDTDADADSDSDRIGYSLIFEAASCRGGSGHVYSTARRRESRMKTPNFFGVTCGPIKDNDLVRPKTFSFCLVFLILSTAYGQTAGMGGSPDRSPRIGLVLSGGGARGISHIGVLRWFEAHRIPVDYVAGTSIGGLVGGLYAMGMASSEIADLMQSIDWARAFASRPSYSELSFRRKEDRRNYQVEYQMGARNGIQLAPRLSSPHYIGLLIDRLTLPYSTISSFDDLPIPFRCTATDLLTAQSLILKDGSLASAMQATMAIPGVFPPVERNGKYLVDGGLLNNLPADLARGMKADVVIAVDIGTKLGDVKTIETLQGILTQTITIMTIDSDRRNLPLADIILTPDLGAHSILDFSAIKNLIDIGYQGAETKASVLQQYSLDPDSWNRHLAARNGRKITRVPVPEAIEVAGIEEGAQEPIRDLLKSFVGKELDTKRLETVLTMLAGQGRYESLDYQFARSRSDPPANILLIRVKERPYAPPTLDFGLQLDGSDIDAVHFNIGTRFTLYDIGKYGSEWRNDLRFGFKALLASEYFFPIGRRGFFVAPEAYFVRFATNLFSAAGARVADYQTNRAGLRSSLGFMTRRMEFQAGYEIGRFAADVRSGEPPVKSAAGLVRLAYMRWAFDGTDSATMPSRGLRFTAEGSWISEAPLATSPFPTAEINALMLYPVSRRGSVFVNARFGTAFNKTAPPEMMFTLGGPFKLGAYDYDEFRGSHSFLGSLGYRHEIGNLSPFFGGKIYGIAWFDAGGAYADFRVPAVQYQGSAGLMMDTKLGSFSIIGAAGKSGAGKLYAAFGKFF